MEPEYDEVLVSGDDDELWEYAYDTDKCLVVDWREEDDAVVEEAAGLIPEAGLSAEWTDGDPADLVVRYKGRRVPLGLTGTPDDRSIVLRGLAGVLAGDYELRAFARSLETDTLAVLVKPAAWWRAMDERFPARMAQVFRPITPGREPL